MKNYIQPGNTVTAAAPYALSSGDGAQVGSLFGVASTDALITADVELSLVGVYELAKVEAQAWTAGVLVYWDDSAKLCTTTAADNLLIGVALAAADNPSTTGIVRLNGAFGELSGTA